jgi:hypothetical protein
VTDLLSFLKEPTTVLLACLVMYVGIGALKGKVPDRALPLLSMLGGLALGVAHGLLMGESAKAAFVSAVTGLAAGFAGSGVHESVKAAKAPPGAGDGPSGPPTPKSPRAAPSDLPRIAMLFAVGIGWLIAGAIWIGCTVAERKTAADVAAAAVPLCEEGLVLAAAPELAPLCAALPEVEAIIAELVSEHGSTTASDAGMRAAAPWRPSMAEVHRRIAAKRAKDGGK